MDGIAYGNNMYVAVGEGATILTSGDGAAWTKRDSSIPSNENWCYLHSVAYGNGTFVVVGIKHILSSNNGINWTIRQNGLSAPLNKVVYGNGQFVAVGDNGLVAISSDGIDWEFYGGPPRNLYDVKYLNSQFLAAGYDGSVYASDNGINWLIKHEDTGNYRAMLGVAYGNGHYVATRLNGEILTSPDLTQWTTQKAYSDSDYRADFGLDSVTFANGTFVTVGYNGVLLTSPDGSVWTNYYDGPSSHLKAVRCLNSRFIALGERGTILASSDGATWTLADMGTSFDTWNDVGYGNGKYVAVGDDGKIKTSPDGFNWATANSNTFCDLYNIAYGNGVFVAGGSTVGSEVTLTSSNGVDWTSHSQDTIGMNIIFDGTRFLMSGNHIKASDDGITWTQISQTGAGYIAYDGATYVAVNGDNVGTSLDAATWNQTPIDDLSDVIGLTCGNGVFALLTDHKQVYVSSDGVNWTKNDLPEYGKGIAYGSGCLVVAGNWGIIQQSGPIGNNPAGPPSAPANLSADDPDNTSQGIDGRDFHLSWSPSVSNDVTQQKIYILPAATVINTGTQTPVATINDNTTHEWTGDASLLQDSASPRAPLAAGNYKIYVVAVNANGSTQSSTSITAVNDTVVVGDSVTVAADGSNRNLVITAGTPGNVDITVPDSVTDATVNVGTLLNAPVGGTVTSDVLPALNINAVTSLGSVQIQIPSGATVSAPEGWDGTIHVPTVQANNTVNVAPDQGKTATVSNVIEVGFGDIPLTFDKAVKIVIPDQAGKDVGYYRNGVFTKITTVLASDSQAAGDALPPGGDGRIDVGSDLVIWTKHFTAFVSYTQTTVNNGGGGGGGGGGTGDQSVSSTTGSALVPPGTGGTISLGSAAKISIPAHALNGSKDLEVAVAEVADSAAAPAGFRILGKTYEFAVSDASTYSFAKPVTLSFTFDPSSLKEGETPAVYYYDESTQTWVSLGGTVSGNTVSVSVNHFTRFAVLANTVEKKFSVTLNDISGNWAENNIRKLVSLGCITGYPDGTFRPDQTITRAEIITVLVKALKLPLQTGGIFSDTSDNWAKDYISTACGAGIVSGYSQDKFGPEDLVTREQLAVMILHATKRNMSGEEKLVFQDEKDISPWAREAVAAAVKNRIFSGYTDNTIRAAQPATRAEAVSVIMAAGLGQ